MSRRFGFLLLSQYSLMAFASASEPLRAANRLAGRDLYTNILVSADGQPVRSSNGMTSVVDHAIAGMPAVDVLVVCSSFDPQLAATGPVLGCLRRQAAAGTVIIGVDTGSWIMARAGLLDDRTATVHWEYLDVMQEEFPRVRTVHALYVMDGGRGSAAGATACLDLMLHLIREDHGRELAVDVADMFVYSRMRRGEDRQRLKSGDRLNVPNRHVARAMTLMEQNLDEPVATAALAEQTGISLREMERLFRRFLSTSPGAWYRRLRLERARHLLEYSDLPVSTVAARTGFGSLAAFSRSYRRHYGHPPSDHRRQVTGIR